MANHLLNLETIDVLLGRAGLQRPSEPQMQQLLDAYGALREMLAQVRPAGGYEAEPSAVFAVAAPGSL